jgi:uncharacterized protein (DUF305 family)
MSLFRRAAFAALVAIGLAPGLPAQAHHPAAAATDDPLNITEIAQGSATPDFEAAMQKMHEQMMAHPMSGNADRDFAMHMIPHHQGAIDMARVQLEHGTDPELRKMAEKIISDQEKEIAQLKEWLAKQ